MMKIDKKLIVRQEEPSDCGVCSLLSVIRFYGGNISLEELRISSLTSSTDGVSVYNLTKCAREYNMDSISIKQDKIPNNLPCIALIRINKALSHFIVIYSIDDKKITYMDPAKGEEHMLIDDYYKISTNIYILLKPKCELEYQKSINIIIHDIKLFIHNHLLLILKILLYNLIFIVASIIYSNYITVIQTNFNFPVIILFLILILISNLMLYLINDNTNRLNKKMSLSLMNNYLSHIFNLPLKYIHIKDSNEIIKRIFDLDSIKELILSFIINLLTNTFVILIISFILFKINHYLLIIIFTTLILYLTFVYFLNKNIKYDIDKIIDKDELYNNYLIDYIGGLTSIKHSSSEVLYKNKLCNTYDELNDIKYNYNKHILKIDFLKQSFITSIEFILNIFIIYQIQKGVLSFEYLLIINLLFTIIINSIITIGNHIPSLIYQRKLLTKINEFYNVSEETNDDQLIKFKHLDINDLSFSYNGYKNNINNINLKIRKKDKIILKGESGCGKSTLCKLINKEYTNYTGNILLNNINYHNIDTKTIRNIIGYSSQNEVIFHDTIRNNILMGHQINDDKLKDIIDTCELNRIISKKIYGLDTFLYGGGSELSGGERQLIFLARLLVLDKQVLILDEALSEVNDKVEDKILYKLFNKYKDKTIIYVSHKNKKNYFKKTIYVGKESNNGIRR